MINQPHSPLSIAALTDQQTYHPTKPASDTPRSPPLATTDSNHTAQPPFQPSISSPTIHLSPTAGANGRSAEESLPDAASETMAADEDHIKNYEEPDGSSSGSDSPVRKLQAPPTNSADEQSDHDYDKPEQRTKYGRTINKPEHFSSIQTTGSGRKSQKRRTSTASGYAGSTHKIFCTICHRGNSPQNNRIVLCDKCDRPFHQQCHMPPIESITLEIEGTTWFCNQCESERESRLVVKHELDGRNIEKETKMAYLLSLPKSFLIDMIFSYERNYPGLKMYPSNLRSERVRRDSLSGSPPRRADMIDSHDDDGSGYNLDDVPSYEDMIEKALIAIGDPRGSSPRSIWEWMGRNYPLAEAFPRSASQSLQKAVKKGRFFKEGSCYKMNPNYIPEPKSRRGARKPSFIGKDGTMIRPSKRMKIQLNEDSAEATEHQKPLYNRPNASSNVDSRYSPYQYSPRPSSVYNSGNPVRRLASPLEADDRYRSPIESDNCGPWRQPEKYNRVDRVRDVEDLNIRDQSHSQKPRDWSLWKKHDDYERHHRDSEQRRDWYGHRDTPMYEGGGQSDQSKTWSTWPVESRSKPAEWLSQRREPSSKQSSPRQVSSLPPLAQVYSPDTSQDDQDNNRSQTASSLWEYRPQART